MAPSRPTLLYTSYQGFSRQGVRTPGYRLEIGVSPQGAPEACPARLKTARSLAAAEQLPVHDNRSVDCYSSDRNNVDPGNTFGRND